MKYHVHQIHTDEILEVDCSSVSMQHGALIFWSNESDTTIHVAIASGRWNRIEVVCKENKE